MSTLIPSWYDPARCGKLFRPELDRATDSGKACAKQNGIKAAGRPGQPNIVLSVIDVQVDFVSKDVGNLYVSGAEQDTDRLNRFIFNNVGKISHIVASLDTHYLFQPFHRYNWAAGPNPTVRQSGPKKGVAYATGECPDPFTMITEADLNNGAWVPTRNPLRMREMVSKLEKQKKKNLVIWPSHCELGTPGHAFDPTFMEALRFHAGCRNNQYMITTKGMSQSSEHYGILRAEVEFADDPHTKYLSDEALKILTVWEQADRVYFAGQAKSHCVLETINQVVETFQSQGKNSVLSKLYVLEDCMSSVPDICDENGNVLVPFDKMANDRFAELKKLGLKFVKSTDVVNITI